MLRSPVANWVSSILHQSEAELCFDEIYMTCFDAYQTGKAKPLFNLLQQAFESEVAQFREEIAAQSRDSIAFALTELWNSMFIAITKLSAAFDPLRLADRELDIVRSLVTSYKTVIYDSPQLDFFLVSFAHSLPGSSDLEGQQPLLKELIKFLDGRPKLDFFFDHIIEATDAYCIEITTQATRSPAIQSNFLIYFGLATEILESERKLWRLLPPHVAERLSVVLLRGLTSSVKDKILFCPQASKLILRHLVNDHGNWATLKILCETILVNDDIRDRLIDIICHHYMKFAGAIAKQVEDKKQSTGLACEVINHLIDAFEMVDLLQICGLPQNAKIADRFRDLLKFLLEDRRLRVESSMSRFIDQTIDRIQRDPSKMPAELAILQKCRPLIRYMRDPVKFARFHARSMFARMFRCSGSNHAVESSVLKVLDRVVPPTYLLHGSVAGTIAEFEQADATNKAWMAAEPKSPMQVLLLSSFKTAGIATRLSKMVMPPAFMKLQDDFEVFYCGQMKATNIVFNWIYEDNMVALKITTAACLLRLRVPLALAVVLAVVYDKPNSTPQEIASWTGLQSSVVSYLVNLVRSSSLPLLSVNGTVEFNPMFRTDLKRLEIQVPQFALPKPEKAERVSADSVKDIYQTHIMRILKAAREVRVEELYNKLQKEIGKMCAFSKEEFDRTLAFLESVRFIRRDPAKPASVFFVPD
jgi:hypothetical protein